MREIAHRYAGPLPSPKGQERFKNMFKPDAQPAPPAAVVTPTPPPTMPDMMSPAVLDARRRAVADAGTAGRTSTILTTPGSRAGKTIAGGAGESLGAR